MVQYHSRSGDIEGYCTFIERLIDRHGESLATLQVGEEPNLTDIHHALRDARSAGSGLFCHFGLMTDDYTPKPAFHVYRDLINTSAVAFRSRPRTSP